MQDLKISLVQTTQFWEDKSQNLAHFEGLLEQIEQSDLIVLPEMFHTGFSMNVMELAEEMDNSLALNWLKNQAKKKKAAIFTSFIAKENNVFFNRGIFVFPDDTYTLYDKRKLFSLAKEDEYFTSGKKQVIVEYKSWKINLQICFDLRFPEISRNKIDTSGEIDYDLCLYVANWPEKRSHHWKSLLVARAIENQAFVGGLNRVGKDGKDLVYSGDSKVIDALGQTLNEENAHQEIIQTITLKKQDLIDVRTMLSFLKDA
ncbi:MAG: amidohydrolase [Bacteroidota bacterium]